MTDFTAAKAYQVEDIDKYETPGECLVAWVDSEWALMADCILPERAIRQLGSVTVGAYRLVERVHMDLDSLSDDFMTMFEEAYADEHLGRWDNIDELKDQDAYRRCKQAIWTALADFAETLPVTRLEPKPFASRTYSADEVIAILRELKPEWFREVANG